MPVISAPRFSMSTEGVTIPLSELKGITSAVEPHTYIFNDHKGKTIHTKQFGKTNPPQITVITALDTENFKYIMTWHEAARAGSTESYRDVTLTMYTADGKTQPGGGIYVLHEAWLAKLELAGAKAGQTEMVTVTMTMECDHITVEGVPEQSS